jgi:hypothetical protein
MLHLSFPPRKRENDGFALEMASCEIARTSYKTEEFNKVVDMLRKELWKLHRCSN